MCVKTLKNIHPIRIVLYETRCSFLISIQLFPYESIQIDNQVILQSRFIRLTMDKRGGEGSDDRRSFFPKIKAGDGGQVSRFDSRPRGFVKSTCSADAGIVANYFEIV